MNVPPVQFPAPPAPPAPRAPTPGSSSANTMKLVVGFVVLMVLLMSILVAVIVRSFVQGPQLLKNFGEPTVMKTDGAWSTYRFDDLGITVDLPVKPTPNREELSSDDRFLLKSYGEYTFESDEMSGDLSAWNFQMMVTYKPKEYADRDGEGDGVKRIAGDASRLDGRQVYRQTVEYDDNDPTVMEAIYWNDGSSICLLRASYYKDDPIGKAQAVRIINSLKFAP